MNEGPTDNPLTFDEIVNGKGLYNEYDSHDEHFQFKKTANWIECADGTTLSVQAAQYLYCSPRDDDGPYYEVEVGFPSVAPPDTWAEYFDGTWGEDDPTGTVYGYIPVELVKEFIEMHGGEKVK